MGKSAGTKRNEKHAGLLMSAKRVFLEHGYANTSMDLIAEKAGTTKRTLYSYFQSKDGLFSEILELGGDLFVADILPLDPETKDVQRALEDYLTRIVEIYCWQDAVALQRIMLAEQSRFPDVARALHRKSMGRVVDDLTDWLTSLQKQGRLRSMDVNREIKSLLNTTTAGFRLNTLFGIETPVDGPPGPTISKDIDREPIRLGVEAFFHQWLI